MTSDERRDELIEDVAGLFTLTRRDANEAFDAVESICMLVGCDTTYSDYAVVMTQVFWTTMFNSALVARLEDSTNA